MSTDLSKEPEVIALFTDEADGTDEIFRVLADGEGPFRLESILSCGQASPQGFWYDQDEDEWVALLSGRATLVVERRGREETVTLEAGQALYLPAHCRHRIESTTAVPPCRWLALHGNIHLK